MKEPIPEAPVVGRKCKRCGTDIDSGDYCSTCGALPLYQSPKPTMQPPNPVEK